MSQRLTIALDAMGGDKGPDMVIAGADIARERHPQVHYLLFGDAARIEPLLAQRPALRAVAEVRHTPDAVAGDAKPSVALRAGRQSSMRLAIDSVAGGQAGCVVSAGNTGALMAMAKFVLKTIPGIDRPAIASFFPTLRGESVMLDLGANTECQPENLVQFAVMGAVFARTALNLSEPTIGVLNIGSEEVKGNEVVRAAATRLREMPLPGRFHGFVEGNDIATGTVDVIVTDGFTGNVALKTAEGTAKLFTEFLRRTFQSSWTARLGYLLARGAFKRLKQRTDPRRYNGAMFLGLRGVCVKSHGGTDAIGFANAIGVAYNLAANGFNDRIKEEMQRLSDAKPLPDTKAAAV
ncbi:phosphate acyltransferase PlsX [Roseomonas genomospecies 6]|uniref:Phosphate acyltransferase n=1 Tax=Roseomonas genomospecies 6 TaxID=214106 RepID=A0A9W7NKQ1_9PROT|nr:phosphate acyltransferase PlsX [Roseomonas genomospecies 6]KAA0681477.1 phosphate acyltransferase PlsX [Roseomonas genomospecies 6]